MVVKMNPPSLKAGYVPIFIIVFYIVNGMVGHGNAVSVVFFFIILALLHSWRFLIMMEHNKQYWSLWRVWNVAFTYMIYMIQFILCCRFLKKQFNKLLTLNMFAWNKHINHVLCSSDSVYCVLCSWGSVCSVIPHQRPQTTQRLDNLLSSPTDYHCRHPVINATSPCLMIRFHDDSSFCYRCRASMCWGQL